MARQNQTFQMGQFGKGLITGLIFGLIFAALLAWMVGSRPMPKETASAANASADCRVCLENAGKAAVGANATGASPRQFNFYNTNKNTDPYTHSANKANPPAPAESPPAVVPTPAAIPTPPPPAAAAAIAPPAAKTSLYLRTKLFNKLGDVEAIKAELALMGFEPKMQVKNGQFLLQMGPYSSNEQAEKARKELGAQAAVFVLQ